MIYFLVNNNFHLIDAEEHLTQLKNHPTGLITINHKLTISPKHQFDVEMEFPLLINRLIDHFHLFRIFKIHKKVRTQLKNITSADTLIFYTEYEHINHYVIRIFKKKKAKVILIEEGFPTYIAFTSIPDNYLSIKKKALSLFVKYILGYSSTKIVSLNSHPTTQINDDQIDLLLLYTDIKIRRNVKTALLPSKRIEFNNLDDNTFLFLNEGLYGYYITMEEYLSILDDILYNASKNFETIYFKFHPREKEDAKEKIQIIIDKHKKVKVIQDNKPVELMIEEIGAKYVSSFLSQTTLYLANSNCISFYIFNLYPELMKNAEFITVKKMIDEMNYKFITTWDTVKNGNHGFKSSDTIEAHPLHYYLNQY